jgi:hypothetical protein
MLKSKHSGWTWDLKRTPFTGGGSGGGGSSSAPAATSQTQTVSTIAPWAQPGVSNLINQQMANMFPNQTTNADGSINLGQQAGYTAFGQNGAGIGPNQMAAANAAVAGFSPLQQMAQQGVANMQRPGQFADATAMAGAAGQGLYGTANTANQYGSLGAGYGQSGAQIGTQGGLGYGQMGAGYGQQAAGQAGNAIGIGQMGVQAGQMGAGYGAMGAQQGASYGQNAQNAQAVQGYMNPYLQATLAPAMQLQNQQFGMINAQNQGQATQQGAFGGGRQAVTQGLNQQNQMLAQNQLTSNAYNQAYNVANQNMQQAAALGMQGAGLGIQGQNAAISGANTGLAGMNAANALYNTGIAGANTGLQGVNTALAGTAQGMRGAEVGLQGVNAAQAGYTGAGNQATNLANIGTQQQAADLGIYNAQNALGKEQQGNQQAVINQAIQNYANTQNYPMQQAYNLEGLYTGAPTAQTQTQYMAPPSAVNTAANAAVGTYAASRLVAKGGLMKTKEYAAGGQVAFDVGGAVESDLYNMDDAHLMQEAKSSPSMEIRKDAMRILAERQMEKQAMNRGVGAAPAAQGMQMAGGGIVAFTEGGSPEKKLSKEAADYLASKVSKNAVKPIAADVAAPGIMKRLGTGLGAYELANTGMGFSQGAASALAGPEQSSRREMMMGAGGGDDTAFGAAILDNADYSKEVPSWIPDWLNPNKMASAESKTSTTTAAPPAERKPGAGTNTQKSGNDSSQTGAPSGYESEIQKRLAAMDQGLGSSKSQADLDALREEIKNSPNKLWTSLLAGAGKGLSATSPFANVGIGNMVSGTTEAYDKAATAERADKKLLIAQQSALDQLEYARKTGNLNALITAQARLDQIKQHRENIKLQYASIGATKEASLSAAKIKAHGDTVVKLMAQGMDENQATALADRLYSGQSSALPEGVKVTKISK